MKIKWITCSAFLIWSQFFSFVVLADAPNVEVIVNSSLYGSGEISPGLNQYLQDIRNQGYNPVLTTTSFADAPALRTHLADRYSNEGLAGAVFIGNLPVANYEIPAHGSWTYENFPCDLYFQDLNGMWGDSDNDGIFNGHIGHVSPEIWVGRLLTHTLTGLHSGRTEAGMLNDYFTRNHNYRTLRTSLSNNGLAYVDDDWEGFARSWGDTLEAAVGGDVSLVSDGATTVAADYKSRIRTEYEHVLLCAHSTATKHHFKIGDEWTGGCVFSNELEDLNPQVFFYNLYACSNTNYTIIGYMAGEYVFGTDCGLLAVGSTKTGSMREFNDYFDSLGDGEIFGEALKNWWLERARDGFNMSEKDWYYGMTMIGDPLLLTQEFIPEPVSVVLLLYGGVLAMFRRRKK